MKSVFVSLAVLLTLFALTACSVVTEESSALDSIKERGTLKVATSGTLYPASYHDDTDGLTGYEVEVVREVASRLDVEVEFTEMGFAGMLSAVENSTVDMAANDIAITDERKEKFSFSHPIKYSYGGAVVRKDDLSRIKTFEDLQGKKAAGAATTIYMDLAEQYGAEPVTYDNATNEEYLRDVSNGRTDIILNDYYLQRLAVKNYPDFNITVHPDLFYMPNDQAIIMKKDNNKLIEEVNGALEDMKDDGTITALSKKFFDGADVSEPPNIDFE
ncbi:transporter substrate-binding domain-containing protein [Litoribacterium kuwaitense]|uniref:transporter substrate-binding domain-containing protein n=1 Tax=Litoribacterium kuwaitense TaxID=1398745 RepID=UPI0035E403D4